MAMYKLEPDERLVGMTIFQDRLIVATSHRLFELWEGWDSDSVGAKKVFKIRPILYEHPKETKDANAKD